MSKGPAPKPIDWPGVISMMEWGEYTVHDMAMVVGLSPVRLGQRATSDLKKSGDPTKEALYARWRKASRLNAFAAPEHGTPQMYARHLHQGEPACDVCKAGKAAEARLYRWEKEQEGGVVEYKVDRRWSKKWKREVFVVERHASTSRTPRMIASYRDREVARKVAGHLNDNMEFEN